MNKLYNVGIYIRLSKDSAAYRNEESMSIENQKLMLAKFISMMPGWIERRYYIDDGWSGGTFDRPSFIEMMEDVKKGEINLVLVKDLSRFGRNYLEAGRYLEQELPSYGCRFVSLSEGIDTETGEDDIIPFLNAMNDHYLKNLSERIKLVLTVKAKDGQKLSGYAPYGYTRSPENKTHLIVDDYSAGMVKKIFSLRTQGMGYAKIAAVLNEAKVMAPRLYYYISQNRTPPERTTEIWFSQTVRSILRNEVYIGNTISFKLGTRSYRDNKTVKKPKEDWIRVDGTHEAIINTDVWQTVCNMSDTSREMHKKARKAVKSLFSGMIVCAGCGRTLMGGSETHTRKNGRQVTYNHYHCRTFSLTGGSTCSRHTIYELSLKKVLLAHIRTQARRLQLDEAAMLEELRSRLIGNDVLRLAEMKAEARSLEQRLHKLEVITSELYEQRVVGNISDEAFTRTLASYDSEKQEKEKRLASITKAENDASVKISDIQRWTEIIREKSLLEDVDREMLGSLIEKIEVGERKIENGIKKQDIKICYRFVGSME